MATVLVVDDDPVIRRLLEVNLEMEGYDVVPAGDGQEALDAMRANDVALVLLDVMMPNVDGWETRRQMLADPDLEEIPVIFLSARAQDADKQRGSELGGTAYVTKPFDPIELLELVGEVLSL
jgi:DNA-binding response OmpR family regulator